MRSIISVPLFLLLLQGCVHSPSEKQPKVVTVPVNKITVSTQSAKQPETDCRQLPSNVVEEQSQPLSATASDQECLMDEAMRIKRQFVQQIFNGWRVPPGTSGLKAEVRVILNDNGHIWSIVIINNSQNNAFDASVQEAIRRVAPFKLPADAELRKRARNLTISFKSK